MSAKRDRDALKIKPRQWDDIAENFARALHAIEGKFLHPEEDIEELATFIDVYGSLKATETGHQRLFSDLEGLRLAVLNGAYALCSRSVNVLRSSIASSSAGYRSWSRATGYQSAFFAMESINHLLGVVIVRDKHSNMYFQVDLWPEAKSVGIDGVDAGLERQALVHRRGSPQHHDRWSIFIRLICACQVPSRIWGFSPKEWLQKAEPKSLVEQRNKMHYRISYWPYDDLWEPDASESVDDIVTKLQGVVADEFSGSPEFGLGLGIQTCSMAIALLADIEQRATGDQTMMDKLAQAIDASSPGTSRVATNV